ncbi:alpha/beta hydrolase [Croceicoccus sp. F390]|uniref:Alpha/beta hydrolase n=1 Tax=Croceicoccus esteveae TaxID=3075597 RepID=A0ABU2ZF35_9SPHN|nr:alpha/beta hydrolase [Croceicoccus sp. F390]MDT0575203.1 alpha/beta hydrolase [Croceicoccus sp. F390]
MLEEKLSIPISLAGDDDGQFAVTFFRPERQPSGICFFCLPGGGTSWRYYDLGMAEGFDLSFARRMTALGHCVAAMDNPGTGDNALGAGHAFLKPRIAAEYVVQCASHVRRHMNELVSEKATTMIGAGHSMGGMMIVLAQGHAHSFDAVCLMGSSAGGLDWGLDEHERQFVGHAQELERALPELVARKFDGEFPLFSSGPDASSAIFAGETPAANALLCSAIGPLYAAGGIMAMISGSFEKEACGLDCPAFFLFGGNDIGVPPTEAVSGFPALTDVRLLVLPNTGHNHFGYRSMASFTARLDRWAEELSGLPGNPDP